MAGLSNPRKNFRYRLEVDGVNMFEIQEVQAPSIELPKIEHGSTVNDPNRKTPGKMVIGDLVIKKVKSALIADSWAHDWMALAMAGGADAFLKTGFLRDLDISGAVVLQSWYLGNVWPTKIETSNRSSMGGENLIETITLSVDVFYDTNSPIFAALFATGAVAGAIAIAGATDR